MPSKYNLMYRCSNRLTGSNSYMNMRLNNKTRSRADENNQFVFRLDGSKKVKLMSKLMALKEPDI